MKKVVFLLIIGVLFLLVLSIGVHNKSVFFPNSIQSQTSPVQTQTDSANGIPNLPVYPGATMVSASVIPDQTIQDVGKRYQQIWNSTASIADISSWYQKNFTDAGWIITAPPTSSTQPVQLIVFTDNNKTINLSLTAQKDPNMCKITVDYLPGPITEEGEEK